MPERYLLVTGGRDLDDKDLVWETLSAAWHEFKPFTLLEGDARGADRLAGLWAETHRVPHRRVPAQWGLHGRAAGVIRNEEMVGLIPFRVHAYPGGRDTAHCTRLCLAAGIPVHRWSRRPDGLVCVEHLLA